MVKIIMSSSLVLGYVPKSWRKARGVVIPKDSKRDTTQPKSNRPISLTSSVFRTMENVVCNYIRTAPWSALRALKNTIQVTFREKETILCTILDIEGAFDNTPHAAVEKALITRGISTQREKQNN